MTIETEPRPKVKPKPTGNRQNGDVDLYKQYLTEIGREKLLSKQEQLLCGAKIFSAKLATRTLRHLKDSRFLNSAQKDEVEILLSDKHVVRFEQHLGSIFEPGPNGRERTEEQKEDLGDLKKIVKRYERWEEKKLEELSKFNSSQERDDEVRELIERKVFLIRRGIVSLDDLVNKNLRLGVNRAKRYQDSPTVSIMDRTQQASMGILTAALEYNFRKKLSFTTYATHWIKQFISRGLMDSTYTIRLPVHVHELINDYNRTKDELTQKLGRIPSLEEVCAEANLKKETLEYALRVYDIYSLNQPLFKTEDGEGDDLGDFIEDRGLNSSPEEEAAKQILKEEMEAILLELTPRERKIIQLRFGLGDEKPMTLKEIGEEFDLTRERIRQIATKTLGKLEMKLRKRKIDSKYFLE